MIFPLFEIRKYTNWHLQINHSCLQYIASVILPDITITIYFVRSFQCKGKQQLTGSARGHAADHPTVLPTTEWNGCSRLPSTGCCTWRQRNTFSAKSEFISYNAWIKRCISDNVERWHRRSAVPSAEEFCPFLASCSQTVGNHVADAFEDRADRRDFRP